jgi:hypothetical protein
MINFPDSIQEREKLIIQCIKDGLAQYNFVKLTISTLPNKIEILVFEDALKIDNIRINVSAKCQQQIADLLDCVLPTAKIYDWMWILCDNKINPSPQLISSSVKAMIAHSQRVDKLIESIGNPTGLKSTVGKTWILSNKLVNNKGKAVNYGWHFQGNTFQGIKGEVCASQMKNPKTGVYYRVIQGIGTKHDYNHSDYSQICSLVSRQCWVDGLRCDLAAVLQNYELADYLNHEGIIKLIRQPGA